ncbi:unnamed protein product [Urochloa decumbens]|uniref:DUF1618 domain-containing protein n=1 Tax=Urochloa decumbens TaxID=240449 RepID=A0ABC9AN30_9POAL
MEPTQSPAAAKPRWVMLMDSHGCSGSEDVADAKTTAASCTSTGWRFRVSFAIAAPPAFSFLHSDMLGGAPAGEERHGPPEPSVIAAHGDSVLFRMAVDCFVYTAGSVVSRLPSLSLLPAGSRALSLQDTGILRRGDDELLVVDLTVSRTCRPPRAMAELCVLRLANDWEINTAVPIVHGDGGGKGGDGLPDFWKAVAAVPVGDRYLCWINYLSGFLLCDMADKTSPPKLPYVRLPDALTRDKEVEDDDDCYSCNGDEKPTLKRSRNMCAAGASSVRLVSVDPRCCCGGPGSSSCHRSRHAFTVTTWTMTLRPDKPMAWVKDGVLDSDELWALPEYGSLPRVPLQYPVVSSDDADIVCFVVRSDYGRYLADSQTWTVEVNTRSKTLRSVVPCSSFMAWKAESIITAKLNIR